jgi:hypothetical protein
MVGSGDTRVGAASTWGSAKCATPCLCCNTKVQPNLSAFDTLKCAFTASAGGMTLKKNPESGHFFENRKKWQKKKSRKRLPNFRPSKKSATFHYVFCNFARRPGSVHGWFDHLGDTPLKRTFRRVHLCIPTLDGVSE